MSEGHDKWTERERAVGLHRCDWCGWPLAESRNGGCVEDDCSMRPMPPLTEYGLIKRELRAALKAISDGLRWRPLAERPARTQRVMVWIPAREPSPECTGTAQIVWFVEEEAPKEYFGAPGFHTKNGTHWMPLPGAPT